MGTVVGVALALVASWLSKHNELKWRERQQVLAEEKVDFELRDLQKKLQPPPQKQHQLQLQGNRADTNQQQTPQQTDTPAVSHAGTDPVLASTVLPPSHVGAEHVAASSAVDLDNGTDIDETDNSHKTAAPLSSRGMQTDFDLGLEAAGESERTETRRLVNRPTW